MPGGNNKKEGCEGESVWGVKLEIIIVFGAVHKWDLRGSMKK